MLKVLFIISMQKKHWYNSLGVIFPGIIFSSNISISMISTKFISEFMDFWHLVWKAETDQINLIYIT